MSKKVEAADGCMAHAHQLPIGETMRRSLPLETPRWTLRSIYNNRHSPRHRTRITVEGRIKNMPVHGGWISEHTWFRLTQSNNFKLYRNIWAAYTSCLQCTCHVSVTYCLALHWIVRIRAGNHSRSVPCHNLALHCRARVLQSYTRLGLETIHLQAIGHIFQNHTAQPWAHW